MVTSALALMISSLVGAVFAWRLWDWPSSLWCVAGESYCASLCIRVGLRQVVESMMATQSSSYSSSSHLEGGEGMSGTTEKLAWTNLPSRALQLDLGTRRPPINLDFWLCYHKQVKAQRKLSTFCRRHFKMRFRVWKLFYSELNCTEIVSQVSN